MPLVVSVADLANRTAALLRNAFETGDVEGAFMAMVATASVLNAPNCSLASGESCGARFHRSECDVRDHVCGKCLPGFVGVAAGFGASSPDSDSHGNAPCRVPATTCGNGVLDGDESDRDCGGGSCGSCQSGAACTSNGDCMYGGCNSGGVCGAPPSQPCAANCTGHGVCVHVDVTGARVAARECVVGAWWCSASCECEAGWAGASCARDATAQAEVHAREGERSMTEARTRQK